MELIIHDCMEKIIKRTEENLINLLSKQRDISEFIKDTSSLLNNVGVALVKEALETIDTAVKIDQNRKCEWSIERKDSKTIATEFGDVTYERTYYKNKITKEYKHISDEIVGIKAHDKMDIGLRAKLVESAADLSYSKSGKVMDNVISFTDQTVMNAIRDIGAIPNDAVDVKIHKKAVPVIYIEADEDHVANQKGSCIEPKLIYVHEGRKHVSKKRYQLVNSRFFSGVYRNSEDIWLEVANYLDEAYDLDKVEEIYISGDGARWIKEGMNWIPGSKYVLDRFHLARYLRRATAHRIDLYPIMWNYIENEERGYVKELFDELVNVCESDYKKKEIKEAKTYVLNHWEAVLENFSESYNGCSAEGHVSHILSDRLSSRPLGWVNIGVDQMSRIRTFKANGGDLFQYMLHHKRKKMKEERILKLEKRAYKKYISKNSNEQLDNSKVLSTGKTTSMFKFMKALRGA